MNFLLGSHSKCMDVEVSLSEVERNSICKSQPFSFLSRHPKEESPADNVILKDQTRLLLTSTGLPSYWIVSSARHSSHLFGLN